MATPAQWIEGARPRTLPAALAPVAVGSGAAAGQGQLVWGYALLALVVSLALQVGVNYANDYSDGIRGTDKERVGPVRLVGQRLARAGDVRLAAFLCFGLAALAGLALAALSQAWMLLPIGVVAVLAAWYYTGGKHPYGYLGLGEVFVFVFFGLVATLGTMATMTALTLAGWCGAVGVGALATAILVANNLRDIPTDEVTGKRTLAVRLGDRGTRRLYVGLILVAVVAAGLAATSRPGSLLALCALPVAYRPVMAVRAGTVGRDLVAVLAHTGFFQLAYAVLLAVGLSR